MELIKKIFVAFSMVFALLTFSPASLAAGKIENATAEEVENAIQDCVDNTAAALAAVKNGEDKNEILPVLKKIKQAAKRIESNVVWRLRSKATERVTKARSALKKGNNTKAESLLAEASDIFQEVQTKYNDFNN